MSAPLDLFGFAPSVYVRSVRLALEEKGLPYTLHEVNPFAEGGAPDWYAALQPFGKIPALRDGAVTLYESDAILRYLDAAYPEPPLIPKDALAQARMTQIMRIMDHYGYPAMVWGVFVPVVRGGEGRMPYGDAMAMAATVLSELDRLMPEGADFLAGDGLTLADSHAYPSLLYFAEAAPGRAAIAAWPRLDDWLRRMGERPSVRAAIQTSDAT
ncbi:MAG: glutathione S-transferase family protein [Alphaproteobacteria bacterium]|nr:glutathione S-transferase family protein [Alphaproteobacteria bacterium]